MYKWLENIKVGDSVILIKGGYGQNNSVAKVDRLTKTQIITGGLKFRRTDGWQIGGSSWSSCTLKEGVPSKVAKVKEESRRRHLVYKIEATNFSELSTEQLELITKSIDKAAAQTNP